MFTTLARLATNKVFDLAQMQIWTMQFLGGYFIMQKVYGFSLRKLDLGEDEVRDLVLCMTADYASAQTESQRALILAGINVLEQYLANQDTSEAIKSFEEALDSFARFVALATPQQKSSALETVHAH